MKTVSVLSWCDVCEPETEPAQTLVAAIAAEGQPRPTLEVDLCEVHWKELAGPLAAALSEHGRKADNNGSGKTRRTLGAEVRPGLQPASGRRDLHCLWCPLSFGHITGMTRHLSTVHNLHGRVSVFGRRCPMCGETMAVQLGRHVHREHGQPSVPQAFTAALALGDPHGVVEKVYGQRGVKAVTQTLGELGARLTK